MILISVIIVISKITVTKQFFPIFLKMDTEKCIRRIIENTGLSRADIQEMIENLLETRNDILSKEAALNIIFEDLSCNL